MSLNHLMMRLPSMSINFEDRKKKVSALFAALTFAAATVAFVGTNAATAQTVTPQQNTTAPGAMTNATNGNGTTVSTLQPACLDGQNGTSTAGSTNATLTSNNATSTSNGSTTAPNTSMSAANSTQGSSNTTSTASSSGANVTAIGEAAGAARLHLIEACNAVQNDDSQKALMHMNLVARALDNISGNLTSSAGQTNTATAGNNTSTDPGQSGSNSTNPIDELGRILGLE
jgi:hypothetical protein